MLHTCLLTTLVITVASAELCSDIKCSHVFDYVCGRRKLKDDTDTVLIYKNICYLKKEACEMGNIDIEQVPFHLCNKSSEELPYMSTESTTPSSNTTNGRRVKDFSIVGSFQVCNHTCPTHCTDDYDPVCAQIWKGNHAGYKNKSMVNHCHVDLLSCSTGLNITIQALSRCFDNPSALIFNMHLAAMKSLNLLDAPPPLSIYKNTNRRSYENTIKKVKDQLKQIVNMTA